MYVFWGIMGIALFILRYFSTTGDSFGNAVLMLMGLFFLTVSIQGLIPYCNYFSFDRTGIDYRNWGLWEGKYKWEDIKKISLPGYQHSVFTYFYIELEWGSEHPHGLKSRAVIGNLNCELAWLLHTLEQLRVSDPENRKLILAKIKVRRP